MEAKTTKELSPRAQVGPGHLEARVPVDSDAIARRAYALYEARGRTPGHEDEDWLLAESQLREERDAPAEAPPAPPAARPRARRRERPKEKEAEA